MADAEADSQERTEEPTDQRRKEFREKGRIPVSRDLNAVLSMLVALALVSVIAPGIGRAMANAITGPLSMIATPAQALVVWQKWLPGLVLDVLFAVAPLLVVLVAIASVVGLAQTQGNVSFKVLEPDFEKLQPLEGIKRLVGPHAWVELLKALLKLSAVLGAAFLVMRADLPTLLSLERAELSASLVRVGEVALRLCGATAVALIAPAVLDYAVQVHRINKKMRMTRDELKREMKNHDGDPHVKARRRRMAQQMSSNRMIAAVSEADVVVNNPDHFAVAIRYVHGETEVPQVVAKGVDQMALRIRAEARRHGIPQLTNRPLARTLYRQCDVGDPIPQEMFGPVAEILSFVHRIRGLRGMEQAGPAPSNQ